MAECFLQVGMSEFDDGDIFPLVVPLETLIPNTHEYLFNFIDFDLFQLEEPLKEYLSCLHNGTKPEKKLLVTVIKNLRKMHPYFLFGPENLQSFVNQTIANYIIYSFPEADCSAKRELFSKVSIKRYSIDSSPNELIPDGIVETIRISEHILGSLFSLQEEIRRLVFFALDNSNQYLAALPTSRRIALYSLAYSADSLAIISASFGVQPSDKMKKYILTTEFEVIPTPEEKKKQEEKQKKTKKKKQDNESFYEKNFYRLREAFDHLYWNPDESMPPAFREVMLATADVVDPTQITYDIQNFSNLLDLEVYRMITEETRIRRCKNCHRYFIPANDKQLYCDSELCIALAQSNNTTVIPSKEPNRQVPESFPARSANRTAKVQRTKCPSYYPYRTKYKTMKARIKAGIVSSEEFDKWNQQALLKLDLVAEGKMPSEEYEQWLTES